MPAPDPHAPANVLAERDLLGLLKHAESLAVTTSKIELQRIKIDDGRGSELFFDPVNREITDGEDIARLVYRSVPARQYEAATFESLVGLTQSLRHVERTLVLARLDRIEVILQESGDRFDRIVFPLAVSKSWQKLRQSHELDQAGLRRLLRSEIDAQYDPPSIVSIISKVKFNSGSAGEATVETGKYALSKSLSAEITGTEALPEQVGARTSLWDNLRIDGVPYQARVTLHLDADPATREFTLEPFAGSVEAAEAEALEWLVERLRKALVTTETADRVLVFAGRDLNT